MSTNICKFEYLNNIAFKYYLYLYLCHFPSKNIFGNLLVDFWMTEYIRIFVRKFMKIQIYMNIGSKSHFNICLSIFNEQFKYGSDSCFN